jgi:glycosyltransferase involved in cell wall biosynthesis
MTLTLRDALRGLDLLAGQVDTSDRRPHETIGRFDVVNVRLALTHAWRLHRCLRQHPTAAAYLPISQGAPGYLRDSLLIAIVAAHQRRLYLHLHGGDFRRFYERSNFVMKGMIRATLRYAHQVWTLTPGIQVDFRDLVAPDRLRSLANAVPDPGIPPSRADRSSATDLRVLYVGNMRPDKHCFDLLAAVRLLGSDARGWEVHVAGTTRSDVAGRLQTELAELRNRGVKARALGEIDPTLRARELAWADVLAYPTWLDGQPLVLLETMAAGLPIVATRVGGIPETVTHGVEGILVDREDVDGMADALRRLAADPPTRQRLGAAGRARYERSYRPHMFVRELAALLDGSSRHPLPCATAVSRRTDPSRHSRGPHTQRPDRPVHHMIVHQTDLEHHSAGGTQGFIREFIRYAGPSRRFTVIGVTIDPSTELGQPRYVDVGAEHAVQFVPVARVQSRERSRRLPETATLVSGCHRFRPQIRADVVHFHRAEAALACRPLHRNIPVVLFLHGAGQAHRRDGGGESFWRFAPGLPYALIERAAVRSAARTFVMDRDQASFLNRYSRPVSAGENWYDGTIFSPNVGGPRPKTLVVGWIGRLQESKDPLLAAEVFAELAATGIPFQAWMAGEGPLRAATERALAKAGLSQVEVLGLLSPTDLADHLRATTVCLATSRWEGIPRAVIEALACGVPVVSTDVGDVSSLIRPENGVLLGERDPAAFARALCDVSTRSSPGTVSRSVTQLDVQRVVPNLLDEVESGVLSCLS